LLVSFELLSCSFPLTPKLKSHDSKHENGNFIILPPFGNIMYSRINMEKWDLLKPFQQWGDKEWCRGVNSTMICCKNFNKCCSVPPVQ
jgi:hypothetical protein